MEFIEYATVSMSIMYSINHNYLMLLSICRIIVSIIIFSSPLRRGFSSVLNIDDDTSRGPPFAPYFAEAGAVMVFSFSATVS